MYRKLFPLTKIGCWRYFVENQKQRLQRTCSILNNLKVDSFPMCPPPPPPAHARLTRLIRRLDHLETGVDFGEMFDLENPSVADTVHRWALI